MVTRKEIANTGGVAYYLKDQLVAITHEGNLLMYAEGMMNIMLAERLGIGEFERCSFTITLHAKESGTVNDMKFLLMAPVIVDGELDLNSIRHIDPTVDSLFAGPTLH